MVSLINDSAPIHSFLVHSFLDPQSSGALATTSRAQKAAQEAYLKALFLKMGRHQPSRWLESLAQRNPLVSMPGVEIEAVRRIYGDAIRWVDSEKGLLEAADWKALGIQNPPGRGSIVQQLWGPRPCSIPDFSVDQLDQAHKLIQPHLKERDLVRVFDKILGRIDRVQRPAEFEGTLSERAEAVRAWMRGNLGLLGGITNLNLSELGLTSLPEEIALLNNLQWLNLEGNPIESLPEIDNCFPQLRLLKLANTKITHLPDRGNYFPQLKLLGLIGTSLKKIPNIQNYLPELVCLEVNSSAITGLPRQGCFPKLARIYCENTKIRESEIPQSVRAAELRRKARSVGLYAFSFLSAHLLMRGVSWLQTTADGYF